MWVDIIRWWNEFGGDSIKEVGIDVLKENYNEKNHLFIASCFDTCILFYFNLVLE